VSSLYSQKIIALRDPSNFFPEKSQILSCDSLVANERYVLLLFVTGAILCPVDLLHYVC